MGTKSGDTVAVNNAIVWAGAIMVALLGGCMSPQALPNRSDANQPEAPPSTSPMAENAALAEALASYLAPSLGADLTVDYALLRDIPTQVGVAVPKYYVWFVASQQGQVVAEGAARIAALSEEEFTVLNLVSRSDILADPAQLERIFPAALIPDIERKATAERP